MAVKIIVKVIQYYSTGEVNPESNLTQINQVESCGGLGIHL